MKKLVVAVTVTVIAIVFAALGCTNRELVGSPLGAEQEVVSTCVACHTEKDTLKEVASPETEEVKSEATSGEG
jgi:hypothetical protein